MVNLMTYWSISSKEIVSEAEKMGFGVDIVDKEANLFYIEGNGEKVLFKGTDFGGNSALGLKVCNDKGLTYKILEEHGLPIAKSFYLKETDMSSFNLDKIKDLKYPLIIKPLNESHGDGVMMSIQSFEELHQKLTISFEMYSNMIIQEEAQGDEVRVLVVKGEVILARNRIPAGIKGNGKANIKELINEENKNPLRGDGYNSPLSYIEIDEELISYISKQGMDLNFVSKENKKVQLRGNSNTGTGGTMINVTDIMHKSTKEICSKTALSLGLEICGIDVLSTDISKPLTETGGIILEVGATPGIGGERELTGVNTAKKILEKVFF